MKEDRHEAREQEGEREKIGSSNLAWQREGGEQEALRWRCWGGGVVRAKRKPQDSFLTPATLFGHHWGPWQWEDVLPCIVLLQAQDWVWRPVCSGQQPRPCCTTQNAVKAQLKVGPVTGTWWLTLEKALKVKEKGRERGKIAACLPLQVENYLASKLARKNLTSNLDHIILFHGVQFQDVKIWMQIGFKHFRWCTLSHFIRKTCSTD